MLKRLGTDRFFIEISSDGHRISVTGGRMGDFDVLPSPLFEAKLQTADGEKRRISSDHYWNVASIEEHPAETHFVFSGYEGEALVIRLIVREEPQALVWQIQVENNSPSQSVLSINYPSPVLKNPQFDLFVPRDGGQTVADAGGKGFAYDRFYPGKITMQYFAAYSQRFGIYLGVEDEKAAVKQFTARTAEDVFSLSVTFFAIGGGAPGNSFDVSGSMRWQGYEGDWYDAAMIYAKFVYEKAEWLPQLGRPDTLEKFKDIPFWVSDYIPNSPSQGDNKPMSLSAGSDIYEPDYWYSAPLELQKELGGVPIAYHVYNWHQIPFNIEYPHFLPAKDTFIKNAPKLREKGIYMMPYINAVSWEKRDGEMGHQVNFENTGIKGAVILENGEILHEDYPQKTRSGHTSELIQMCPSFGVWHSMIEKLVREMEETLPIDGVYFDQIAATSARPCYHPEHDHLPGGGSFWQEGYNRMMEQILQKKPTDAFYFTECCAEPYMKNFDGYLTWNWVYPEEVPAFAAIYAGYVQMVGRTTDGMKKDDLGFFKYCNARSLVYGQQLGWCKADLIWRSDWLSFIKNAVKIRSELADVFRNYRMLRPPVVKAGAPKLITRAGLNGKGYIESEVVIAGAWRSRKDDETVIIAVNINSESTSFTLSFDAVEYGVPSQTLPDSFTVDGSRCLVKGTLPKDGISVWRIRKDQ